MGGDRASGPTRTETLGEWRTQQQTQVSSRCVYVRNTHGVRPGTGQAMNHTVPNAMTRTAHPVIAPWVAAAAPMAKTAWLHDTRAVSYRSRFRAQDARRWGRCWNPSPAT